MNPAPPKPPSKTADRKALAAYWSELRRWATGLTNWEADLDRHEEDLEVREAALEQALEDASDEVVQEYAENVGDTMVDEVEDEDCECDAEAAAAGCDCDKCEMIRKDWVENSKQIARKNGKSGLQQAGQTGEVQWLEELWKLEDQRK